MKKYLSLAIIVFFALYIGSGCKKDKGNPPVLPPVESMIIDFSNFESGKKSEPVINVTKGIENSSWEFSALVAGFWNTILVLNLAVPVATFDRATDNAPAYLDNKTWQWSYDVPVTINQVSVTYKARLTGQITATEVIWKMYISKTGTGAFAEFVWYEGTSKLDGTSGKWIINHSSQYPEPMINIDWTKSASDIGTIKYTYVRTLNNTRVPDTFRNSYIEYGLTSASLNAYYNIHYYTGVDFSDVNIEWNTTTHNGRVKSFGFFGDQDWNCWDANRVNTVCP
jgi:hypothetical protein